MHLSFQKDARFSGLAAAYAISMRLLNMTLEGAKDGIFVSTGAEVLGLATDVASAATDVCRLMVELLGWDFTCERER